MDFRNTHSAGAHSQWAMPQRRIPVQKVHFETHGAGQVNPAIVPWGGLLPRPKKPKRPGYAFCGWFYLVPGGGFSQWDFLKDRVRGDMTLYAGWTPSRRMIPPGQNKANRAVAQ